ncbi:histidine kinase [Novosphingobium sp.]|uniref:sensor histidine kinase n=1 Tax=Novosphingobium sp. TaxID=1874826 RepID=UPI00286DFD25|nr:histidine kinase [Novosphingobium sp.]
MAVLPITPAPFFANKNQAFWRLQAIGWGGAMLLRAMSSIAGGQEWSFLVFVAIEAVTGFSISLILSVIYHQLINRRPLVTWGVSALVLPLAVMLYAFIDAWVFSLGQTDGNTNFARLLIGVFYLNATLLGAWSALYYMINFYVQIEEQNDQMIQLENQATSAQLAMLRYQLNPHFLFNTLNSISTLVLLKQTEPANAMLTRLSSFLRYTLANEPAGRVTVAQEVETLKLYLDIERMRFEERLRTRFEIEDAAKPGLLPSLLLQPLVENAIKYAVSPQEAGAEITVTAQLVGSALRITVSDTGPGLQSGGIDNRLAGVTFDGGEQVSTGVGLTNTRDRLAQAYGSTHRFEIVDPPEGGFSVLIEIPYEEREAPAPFASVGAGSGPSAGTPRLAVPAG